ncbi:MAG TPA: hypothetical protein VHT34_11785 [Clostridia bacterium]|nr:hypothetical protein [Clostridia bacterium]
MIINLEIYNEFSHDMMDTDDNILYDSYTYPSHGVELDVIDDGHLKLIYKGALAKNKSNSVFAVVDYTNDSKAAEFLPMVEASPNIFVTELLMKDSRCMNISFKDSWNNWDDNSGKKYAFCTHVFRKNTK